MSKLDMMYYLLFFVWFFCNFYIMLVRILLSCHVLGSSNNISTCKFYLPYCYHLKVLTQFIFLIIHDFMSVIDFEIRLN